MDEKAIARFWAKVEKGDGCWAWKGSRDQHGYGQLRVTPTKLMKAHRISFFLKNGEWPLPHCLHECDNPNCVNPEHLRAGNHVMNMRDKERRGRGNHATGSRNAMATNPALAELAAAKRRGMRYSRLNAEQVPDIRSMAGTASAREVAERFRVSVSTIRSVLIGRTWSHVR